MEGEFRFRLMHDTELGVPVVKWGYPHIHDDARAAIPRARRRARPLRADARRNRERILKAARAVFADQGIDAQIDDVAKRAKVGVGTVYRHFPTKEALLDALVREHFEEIADDAREARSRREDAWEGFCELIWRAAERNAADRAFCEVIAVARQSAIVEEAGCAAIDRRADGPRQGARARCAPTRRGDDVPMMMCGVGAVMQTHPDAERLAPLPHAHARRAARVVVFAAWPHRRRRSRTSKGSPGIWIRCSTAPATAPPASRRCSPTRSAAPTRSPRAHAGKVAELDGAGLAAAMRELGDAAGARRPRRLLRDAALRDRHRRPRARRAAAARAGARHADRDEAAVLRARVGRARRRARRGAARHRRASTSAATTCAPRAATGRTCSPSRRSGSSPRRR